MSEQKPPRNVPRHTVVPTDGGSFTLPAPDQDAEQPKPAKAEKKQTKPGDNDA